MNIREYLQQNRLIADGAMGTYFEHIVGDKEKDMMAEKANLYLPEVIEKIHLEYIAAGAKLIRTNTFAANTTFCEDIQKVKDMIAAGYQIALSAVEKSKRQVFVAADIGPIFDSRFVGKELILKEYIDICDTFLSLGADIFVLETFSDFDCIEEVTSYLKEKGAFTIVQFCLERSGYTRGGLSVSNIVKTVSELESVDAFGFNCGVGASHLYQILKELEFPKDKFITALPNAGYPVELRGRTIYGESERYFVEMMCKVAGLGIDCLGGCCGTTPEYIHALTEQLRNLPKADKKIRKETKEVPETVEAAEAVEETFYSNRKILRKLEKNEKVFVVELDPPFDCNIDKVRDGACILKQAGVDLMTLADSPMARTRADAGRLAAKLQREVEIPIMPHVCCRDRNVIGMRAGFLGDYINDLRTFLIVTGDPVGRDAKGQVTPVYDFNSIRLMEYVSKMNEEVFAAEPVIFGGALNYHGANPDAIAARMQKKMEAGCTMFLTQPIYSDEDVERIAYLKEKSGGKILCGIMPLVSYKNAMFMANEMPGIHVPKEVVKRYSVDMTREEGEAAGIAIAKEMVEKLWNIADGFYFMTPFNRAGMIARLVTECKEIEV